MERDPELRPNADVRKPSSGEREIVVVGGATDYFYTSIQAADAKTVSTARKCTIRVSCLYINT